MQPYRFATMPHRPLRWFPIDFSSMKLQPMLPIALDPTNEFILNDIRMDNSFFNFTWTRRHSVNALAHRSSFNNLWRISQNKFTWIGYNVPALLNVITEPSKFSRITFFPNSLQWNLGWEHLWEIKINFRGLTFDRIQRLMLSVQWQLDPYKLHQDNTKCCSNRHANRLVCLFRCSTLPIILGCLRIKEH